MLAFTDYEAWNVTIGAEDFLHVSSAEVLSQKFY